jgi:prepilin-type N-terminal cleavage/methylation domain-containing protein
MMPGSHDDERGFTVPEMLIAIMMISILSLVTLGGIQFLTKAVDARTFAQSGGMTVDRELATMRQDANTAFAVFVPDHDVFRASNKPDSYVDQGRTVIVPPHEVDYYSKTDTGTESWWAYYYDRLHGALQRYDYDPAAGTHGVVDRSSGAIDPRGAYSKVTGISSFSVATLQADTLTDPARNRFAPIVKAMSDGLIQPIADPVGFVPVNGQPRSDLYGGNTSIQITMTTAAGERSLHLLSGTMPSGFTVHEAPAIRAFVYRLNTHHRSWFGTVSKSRAQIFEQLQYSYHPKTDRPTDWKVWCDYQIYGAGSGGLDYADKNAGYQPKNFVETTSSLFYNTTHGTIHNLNERGCGKKVPLLGDTSAPRYTGTSPDTYETPPPCFAVGTCWPDNAPPFWSPPSPWPSASPPAVWCASHQQASICGGDGKQQAGENGNASSPLPIAVDASKNKSAPQRPTTTAGPIQGGLPRRDGPR